MIPAAAIAIVVSLFAAVAVQAVGVHAVVGPLLAAMGAGS